MKKESTNTSMRMVILPTDGVMFSEEVDIADLQTAASAIGADMVEVVRPAAFAELGLPQYVLLVDESGALKDGRVMNPCASELYGWRRHGVRIYGDALVAKEVATDDGYDIAGLDEDDVDNVYMVIFNV